MAPATWRVWRCNVARVQGYRGVRTLADLPYRFWPNDKLPEGVPQRSGIVTMKAAAFTKPYRQAVVPRLRDLGFEAKDTKASKHDDRLWRSVGLFVSDGYGVVVLAAHLPGLPPRHGWEPLRQHEFNQDRSISRYNLRLTAEVDAFDLGFSEEHGRESAGLMAEAVAEQFAPHLARLDEMEAALLAVEPGRWLEQMTAHYRTFALRLDTSSVFRGVPDLETLTLLARLHARAGDAARTATFADLALAVLTEILRERQYMGAFEQQVMLEQLRAGDLRFRLLTDEEQAEVRRRFDARS